MMSRKRDRVGINKDFLLTKTLAKTVSESPDTPRTRVRGMSPSLLPT